MNDVWQGAKASLSACMGCSAKRVVSEIARYSFVHYHKMEILSCGVVTRNIYGYYYTVVETTGRSRLLKFRLPVPYRRIPHCR